MKRLWWDYLPIIGGVTFAIVMGLGLNIMAVYLDSLPEFQRPPGVCLKYNFSMHRCDHWQD